MCYLFLITHSQRPFKTLFISLLPSPISSSDHKLLILPSSASLYPPLSFRFTVTARKVEAFQLHFAAERLDGDKKRVNTEFQCVVLLTVQEAYTGCQDDKEDS